MDEKLTYSGKLIAYASAFFEFARSYMERYSAFIELWKATMFDSIEDCNPFGSMDTKTTATVIQGLIDGVFIQWLIDPEIDLDRCHQEILKVIGMYMRCLKA